MDQQKPRDHIPHPADVELGSRVKLLREHSGITQEMMASELGITFQQLQKYERGENRISYSRLTEIARALGMRVTDIIAPLEGPQAGKTKDYLEMLALPQALAMLQAFSRITDVAVRRGIVQLLRAITKDAEDGS